MLVGAEPRAIVFALHERSAGGTKSLLVRLAFEESSSDCTVEGATRQAGLYSYFIGSDPAAWVAGAPTFNEVRYASLYEGIDLVLYAREGTLEYDLHLAPGKDLSAFRVNVEGCESLSTSEAGGLTIHTALGDLLQPPARCFQRSPDGDERAVACAYRIVDRTSIAFELGPHDPSLPVVVDPELVWSTYIGSNLLDSVGDRAVGVAVAQNGDAYVTGFEHGVDFPTTPGAVSNANPAGYNVFAARFRGGDGALLYSCLVGGSTNPGSTGAPPQRPTEIRVDWQGRATVAGWTQASDFPTTPGAFQTQPQGQLDGFVFRLNPSGTQLVYPRSSGNRRRGMRLPPPAPQSSGAIRPGRGLSYDAENLQPGRSSSGPSASCASINRPRPRMVG
jgi:hypothetical protein